MLTPSQRNIYHKECSEILIQAKRMTEDIPAFNGPLTEVAQIWRGDGAMQHVHGTNPAQLQIIC